jgi:hypothetical protein
VFRPSSWGLAAVLVALLGLTAITVKRAQTALTFAPIPTQMFGNAPLQVSATSASSGAMTYTVLSGPATLSGNTLTITGGGAVQLSARQAAKGLYGAMTGQISFMVDTATSQTMSFTRAKDVIGSAIASDTPNFLFIDSNGQFFLQNAYSQYDTVPADHVWDFYTGADAQDAKLKRSANNSQSDTQAMCEKGNPVYTTLYGTTGIKPGKGNYADGNFCDAMGVWIDPDTGNWYTIVHNELYPNVPRVDVISYAISKDHGKTWALQAPIATSPYGLGNKKDFYYDYGEGDPRLVVDTSSGYFYLFYNSRVMKPSGAGFSAHEWEHVSRALISRKMEPASWEKYYNGRWSQMPGIAWTCDAAGHSLCPPGEIATSLASSIGPDNDPTINQTFVQPVSKQTTKDLPTYSNSLLHGASVSWDVYLGKYIAFAEDRNLSTKSRDYDDSAATMKFYVSDDLSQQKWTYAGSVPYENSSWYRWMVDPGNLTSSNTIGSTFLAYCSVNCSIPKNDSEYIEVSVALHSGAASPVYYSSANGVKSASNAYSISHPNGGLSAKSDDNSWTFVQVPLDGGFFYLKHGAMYLGVADGNAGRAWGASVSLFAPLPSSTNGDPEMSRQQWYFERIKAIGGVPTSTVQYRLINRYSGLALSFSGGTLNAANLANAVTAPIRDWDTTAPTSFKVWKASDQELILTAQNTP